MKLNAGYNIMKQENVSQNLIQEFHGFCQPITLI